MSFLHSKVNWGNITISFVEPRNIRQFLMNDFLKEPTLHKWAHIKKLQIFLPFKNNSNQVTFYKVLHMSKPNKS